MKKIPPNSVGLAGEFATLSQLMLHGYDAGMTLGHTKNIDVLVFCPKNKKRYEVEVKTNLQSRSGSSQSKIFGRIISEWQMHEKHEKVSRSKLFYCFVHINSRGKEDYAFRYFIVPSRVVATYVRKQHALWLKKDSKHKDTPRRMFRIGLPNAKKVEVPAPLAEDYEDNWKFSY